MAEEKNNGVISKTNSGFPGYLDFDKLRAEGIDYLAKLSGKIWTDHNVHDPGITILEVLCYALMDLGYRTHLPEADILARKPGDSTADDNFFTPAGILACNPLTITDFRKLLIDIAEVKNAWLEIATDQTDFCQPHHQQDPAYIRTNHVGNYADYLNGLYHVYLDLEIDLDKEFDEDEAAKISYVDDVVGKVRATLMAHRNLCEDFVDIYILCKQEVGVCADIALQDGADAEKVYLDLVAALRAFFSPSPIFYTLQQLLDKSIPIEEIFAGRPFNLKESHGFVDTAELEALQLRKEIRLSDVYNALFQVPGINNIRGLSLNSCKGNVSTPSKGWKFSIPKNHVPEFSIGCSGFRFSRNGAQIPVDFQKSEGLLELNFQHNGKILYPSSSPYLNRVIPGGVYRGDLSDYHSIQHDFPRVYGIEEGGLPENATDKRKAEALQLKGYLLFFDQLLASYLTQLSNIRSLFAMSSPAAGKGHTYFNNKLDSVPELQKLLRFNVSDNNINPLGSAGAILVLPVARIEWQQLITAGKLSTLSLEQLPLFSFETMTAQDTAIEQIKNDLLFGQCKTEFVKRNDDCFFYYMETSFDELILVSKKYFGSAKEAKDHAASVQYIGTIAENYRSFINEHKRFSFDIELGLLSFGKYLDLITEDQQLYQQRRQGFLNHLLARFAEQFTDYAILSFGFYNAEELTTHEIAKKEKFLSSYEDLSSNRGRAYDYLANGWNNNNISGFEKRFKALAGIDNWKRHSLCNFVVAQYDPKYAVSLRIAERHYFTAEDKFDTREEAEIAARELFAAMKDPANYYTDRGADNKNYRLLLKYAGKSAAFASDYSSADEATATATRLGDFVGNKLPPDPVTVSAYTYIPALLNAEGVMVRRSLTQYATPEAARSGVIKTITKLENAKKWEILNGDDPLQLFSYRDNGDDIVWINTVAFKIDISNSIIGRPDKFSFDLLDKNNSFKFQSAEEFDSAAAALDAAKNLLALLAAAENYTITNAGAQFKVEIVLNGRLLATAFPSFTTQAEAIEFRDTVLGIVQKASYTLNLGKTAIKWKYRFELGFDAHNSHSFESTAAYDSPDAALAAAQKFSKALPGLAVKEKEGIVTPALAKLAQETGSVQLVSEAGALKAEKFRAIKKLLEERKEFSRLSTAPATADFTTSVDIDAISQQGAFVYRLVDKDHVPAYYSLNFQDKPAASKLITHLATSFQQFENYLRICRGGDILHKRKQENNGYWYHYQLKAINRLYQSGDKKGQALVLFESTKGYATIEEAEKAFNEQYLSLIEIGSQSVAYGKEISLKEILVQNNDPCIKDDSVVFVPAETVMDLGPSEAAVIAGLVALLQSYPIRLVKKNSQEFYTLFPCAEKGADPASTPECGPSISTLKTDQYVYYFRFYGNNPEQGSWQSTEYFSTIAAAEKEFEFFRILLRYPGNYFADCNECSEEGYFRIYLREVLAESIERFPSEQEAWGNDGVERFICVAQSENAFHNYLRKRDCCYSFYLTCGDGLVKHPCTYDTSSKRDKVLQSLYNTGSSFFQKHAWLIHDNGNDISLLNGDGIPFAIINKERRQNPCNSDLVLDLLENLAPGNIYKEENGQIQLFTAQQELLAVSANGKYTLVSWKSLLENFACYYPVIRERNPKTKRYRYCVEIKLPGFNTCSEDVAEEIPCGCEGNQPPASVDCYLAWKSHCCYDSCQEAEIVLETIGKLLLNYGYYQPVHDCDCGSYGIALHFSKADIITNSRVSYLWQDSQLNNWRNSEMIAINPQCYPSREISCEAVSRAIGLINSEGLHLVEHILLRPRCYPDDCNCNQYTERCDDDTNCHFSWPLPENPCTEVQNICFVPGEDRYSFIATIALPAWPARFRSETNRNLLENLLYREAPAHVLLRILWLAPHDFCCFEQHFKGWNKWLAQKKSCLGDFDNCNFLAFLFDRIYECLPACDVCLPCQNQPVDARNPCFLPPARIQPESVFLNQVNDLYCWQIQYCGEYQYSPCNQPQLFRPRPPLRDVPAEINVLNPRVKVQQINARLSAYRDAITEVVKKSRNNIMAEKARAFLNEPDPLAERLDKMITEILANKAQKDKSAKLLTNPQIQRLIEGSILYYLDKVAFDNNEEKPFKALSKTIDRIRKAGINPENIYGNWKAEEVKKLDPNLNDALIKGLFTKPGT